MDDASERRGGGEVADWAARLVIACAIGIALAALAHWWWPSDAMTGPKLVLWGAAAFVSGLLTTSIAAASVPPTLMGLAVVIASGVLDGFEPPSPDRKFLLLVSAAVLTSLAMAFVGLTGLATRLLHDDFRRRWRSRPARSPRRP